MRQTWIVGAVLVALASCTSGTIPDATDDLVTLWRHKDGTVVSSTELAEARINCVRASVQEPAAAGTGIASNPAYYPGGEGLTNAPPGSGAIDRMNLPTSTSIGQTATPLADCLEASGFIPAQ